MKLVMKIPPVVPVATIAATAIRLATFSDDRPPFQCEGGLIYSSFISTFIS